MTRPGWARRDHRDLVQITAATIALLATLTMLAVGLALTATNLT